MTDRLDVLTRLSGLPREHVELLAALVDGGREDDLFRINPLAFAKKHGILEREAVDLFVHAARHGLFDLDWLVVCPSCGGVLRHGDSLRELQPTSYCGLCSLDVEVALDDAVEVAFTVSPHVRPIRFHDADRLDSPEEVMIRYFSPSRRANPEMSAALDAATVLDGWLTAGLTEEIAVELETGDYRIAAPCDHASALLRIQGEPSSALQQVQVTFSHGLLQVAPAALGPGPVRIALANPGSRPQVWLLTRSIDFMACGLRAYFEPFLSAKRLLSVQSFRDLFRSEGLAPGSSFVMRELTFLFTDLKRSTEIYDRVGDLGAFQLVREHFQVLARAVADHDGAIVKTIGDAVMATFTDARAAVSAALAMHDGLTEWNRAERRPETLELKIGLHDGPCIAVDSNGHIDYFGQTVNVAARIQALAEGRETYFSDAIYRAPGVADLVAERGLKLERREVRLKGVSEAVPVFCAPSG